MEMIISILVLIFSAILHEIAHGYVADRLGDPTARLSGRLTLDPRPHIDTNMTIIMPLLTYFASGGSFIFGGAKPVPVDPFNLQGGRKDLALVALAGPATNIVIAIVAAGLLHLMLLPQVTGSLALSTLGILYGFLATIVHINVLLAIFNMIPVPPLDGSKIFTLFMSEESALRYLSISNMGMIILLFGLYATPLGSIIFGLVSSVSNMLLP